MTSSGQAATIQFQHSGAFLDAFEGTSLGVFAPSAPFSSSRQSSTRTTTPSNNPGATEVQLWGWSFYSTTTDNSSNYRSSPDESVYSGSSDERLAEELEMLHRNFVGDSHAESAGTDGATEVQRRGSSFSSATSPDESEHSGSSSDSSYARHLAQELDMLRQGFAGDRHAMSAGTEEEEELSPNSRFQRDLRIRRLRASRSYQPDPIPSLDPEPEPSEDHGDEEDEPPNEPLWRCLDFGEEPVAHAEIRDLASVLGNGTLAAWLAGCPEDLQRSVTAQVRGELGLLWHAAMACEAMWGSGGVSAGRQRKEEEEEEQEEEVQAEEEEETLFSTDEDGDWTSIHGFEDEDEEPRNEDDNGPWSSSDEGLRDSSYDDEQQFDEEAAAAAGAAGGYRGDAAPEQEEPQAALPTSSREAIESFKRKASDLYIKCQKYMQRTCPGSDAAPEQELPRIPLQKMSSKEMAAHFNRKAIWFQAYIRTQERQESTQRTLQQTREAGQPQELEDPPSFFVESEAGLPVSRSPGVSAQRSLQCDNEEVEVLPCIPAESEAGFQQQKQQQPPVEQPLGPSRACAPKAELDVQTRRNLPSKYDNKQQSASQQCFTPEANHPSGEPNRRPEAHICTTPLFWLSQAGRHRRKCSGASGGRPLVGVSRHERQRGGADGSWCRSGTAWGTKQPPTTPRWMSTC